VKFRGVDYYDIDELLFDEEKMTKNLVREFSEREFEPLIADVFHQEKPLNMAELAPKMGELGMIGSFIPREDGGVGANYVTFGLISQETERIDSALGGFIRVQSGLIINHE